MISAHNVSPNVLGINNKITSNQVKKETGQIHKFGSFYYNRRKNSSIQYGCHRQQHTLEFLFYFGCNQLMLLKSHKSEKNYFEPFVVMLA